MEKAFEKLRAGAPGEVSVTRWDVVTQLGFIVAQWAFGALRDWRVSPDELLDLSDHLLDYVHALRHQGGQAGPAE